MAPVSARQMFWLSGAFISAVLVILVAVPLIISFQISNIIIGLDTQAEPADRLSASVQTALAHEISAIVGFQNTAENAYAELYRQQVANIDGNLAQLDRISGQIGLQDQVREIHSSVQRWHDHVQSQQLLTVQRPGGEFRALLFESQHIYDKAHTAMMRFNEAVSKWRMGQRAKLRDLDQLATTLSIVFAFLAVPAVVMVVSILRRLNETSSFLETRVQEQAALRHVAHALTGAVTLDEVLHRITETAALAGDSEAVYIETIDAEKNEVTCVAAYGAGVPGVGTKGPLEGSIGQEVVSSRQPLVIPDAGAEQWRRSIFGELARGCGNCTAIAVPLIADDDVLGALFLVRRQPRYFTPAEFPRVLILADMAAVAMQRAIAVEKIQSAVHARDEVLRIVSHDLRNPLHNIQMTAKVLTASSIGTEQHDKMVQIIERASARMNRLIEDLVAAARVREGQAIPAELHPESPAEIIDEVCEIFGSQARVKSITLRCEKPERVPAVNADRHRILQVFSNLVDNAIKFTPEGGTIAISCEPDHTHVRFSVSDTGRGIEPQNAERIFDLFWQAKATAHMGTGLGLAIAKAIVEQHGGKIWVESKPGTGSTFFFTVPLVLR